MSDLYENLLRATDNIQDITTEKYAIVTSTNGNYCSVKETDTGLEHTNVPIVNGATLQNGDKVIIGFLNNSIYDVIVYGVLDRSLNVELPIVTSWESTTSDAKVPSEKLVKTELDKKIATSSTSGLVKNDGTIDTSSYITSSALEGYQTTGNLITSFSSTPSDSKYPSEKLTKTELDKKIEKSNTTGLVKNDGSIMAGGTGASNWAIGNHTHGNLLNGGTITQTVTNGGNLVVTNSSNAVGVQSAIDVLDRVIQSLITYGSS